MKENEEKDSEIPVGVTWLANSKRDKYLNIPYLLFFKQMTSLKTVHKMWGSTLENHRVLPEPATLSEITVQA